MDLFLQKEICAIVVNGAFGNNVSYVSFEKDKNYIMSEQCASFPVFGDIMTSDGSTFHVMIKLKPRDKIRRDLLIIDEQFHNEITMYNKVIPFLLNCCNSTSQNDAVPSLPRFFYGRNRCGEFVENDIIVLENISPLGYRMSEERIFLDYEHLVTAIQALAKFHAMTYVAKYKDPKGFHTVVAGLLDGYRNGTENWLMQDDILWKIGNRGMDALLKRTGHVYHDHVHMKRFKELIAETGGSSIRRALEAREPFSVVCHGDFNRNNVMFRYDDDAPRRPVDALLFDFGTSRYGSPALELSFLLYMNTTQKMRQNRWDDLLDAYCATLAATVPSGVRVPGRAELDAEMAASALFGFMHAAFFLPMQIDDRRMHNSIMGHSERVRFVLTMGGDEGTEYVADMVQHIVDMGYTNV